MKDVRFNPFVHGFSADPYPQYRALRERDPVHRSFMGTWVVSRHADVNAVLRDPQYSSDLSHWSGFEHRYRHRPPVSWLLTHSVLNQDAPLHTRLRRAVVEAFGPHDQGRLSEIIRRLITERLGEVSGAHAFDAVTEFALPVPVRTVCRVFDVATADTDLVKSWSVGVSSLIEPLPTAPALGDAEACVERFKAYLLHRMADTASDGLPRRIEQARAQHGVGVEHALANLVLMFPAGHETTVNLIGNGLYLLLRHPEQRDRLLREPALWSSAIEEMLRCESPQQVAWRVALSARELDGQRIERGEQLMLMLGAANRDPAAFTDPDRFDVGRSPNRHLAFGVGHHACLGGWFARLQARMVLQALVEAFPTLELDGEPVWYPTVSFHGLRHLPVRSAA